MPITRSKSKDAVAVLQPQAQGVSNASTEGGTHYQPTQNIFASEAGPSIASSRETSTHKSMDEASIIATAKSGRSSCMSNRTIKAKILAAKAEHARRLAQAQAEREHLQAEREREVAELELQAEVAALRAGSSCASSCSSKSQFIENWLAHSVNITTRPRQTQKSFSFIDRNVKEPLLLSAAPQASSKSAPAGALPIVPLSCPTAVEPAEQHIHTLETELIGTRNKQTICNDYHKNKNLDQSVDNTPIIQLANAIQSLRRTSSSKVCDISKFDGHASDWLLFKKSYDQSKRHFSPSDNVARLSAALYGPAKETVAIRLVAADDPEQIVQALETRFAQPELIVLHQLSLVRALPKLGLYEATRDLNVFACRIRNCVDVIRLLNQPEYLASPELSNSIITKLTPLLRSRWADFAATRVNSGNHKLENLADFLEREANLQCKFGVVITESTSVKNQVVKITNDKFSSFKPNKDKIFTSVVSNFPDKTKTTNLCKYCQTHSHEVSECKDFQSLDIDDRWQWVIENKVCRKCLRKGSHQYKTCKSKCKVDGCTADRRHHTLLHKIKSDLQPTLPQLDEDSATVAHNTAPICTDKYHQPLLKIIPVTLIGKKGNVNTFALLDDGSSATLIDKSVADLLDDEGPREPLRIQCIGGLTKVSHVSLVDIKVKGQHCSNTFKIRARSIPSLDLRAQSARISNIKQYSHLSDLSHVLTYENAKPTCLIGTDNWHLLLPKSIRRGSRSEPAAALTPLGWVLFGFINSSYKPVEFVNHLEVAKNDVNLDSLIKNYYKLDSIGIEKRLHLSASDKRALKILEETTVRLPTGQFETGLLWRNDISLVPDSKHLALTRFMNLERKFSKDINYANVYKQNIESMVEKGYAELCTSPPSGNITWYLPHFGVVHAQKKKLRVVHDAAAKCNGISLNSMLLSGPDLLQPLLAIVMRFREGRVALTADIREMFPQIKIRHQDRDAQRFFWRNNVQLPIQEYRMASMIFGATSSPCTALYLKNKNALEFQNLYPEAANCIIDDHYMDDFLGSVDGIQVAARLAAEIVTIHKAAGFEMRSWVSNKAEALSLIPTNLHAIDASKVGLGPSSPSQFSILGLSWIVTSDCLSFLKCLPKPPNVLTKRSTLSLLMSIYDPLGLITPMIVKGRILFQKTWNLRLEWDHSLPEDLGRKWKSWFQELKNLSGCVIPRCYTLGDSIVERRLHVFADGSEVVYACVAYWRFILADETVSLALIGGKARLAPLKPATTIPRMELQGALIAARFASYIIEAHKNKPCKLFLWSDSITVLKWLRSDTCTFKAFVSFRVGEISELTDIRCWRYVPSSLNVADDATRDVGEFSINSRWFTGPSFLFSPETSWPSEPPSNEFQIDLETKRTDSNLVGCFATTDTPIFSFSPIIADYRRFSRWIRLLRATARAHQSAKIFRSLLNHNSKSLNSSLHCHRKFPLLSVNELNSAELHLQMSIQRDSFSDELICVQAGHPVSSHSRLKNVSLLIAEDGLLRLSGRTTASNDIESRPIVLDGKHPITRLLIHFHHMRYAHANNELVVNELRQKFYVVGLRPAVKQVASKCLLCRFRKTMPVTPPTGDLPIARMAHHERPFTYVGVDYFGPMSVTIGRRQAKRWVALFTCLTIRAVHIEVVENLSSDSAIMALRRFIARRGYPSCIYSDNGTAFVGASKMIKEIYDFATTNKIHWKFIPPSAPFMGGCWERLVRNIKVTLAVTLKERSPKEEVFATLLLEAEAIVNSRPLTHVSVDQDSEEALTPFSFLIGSTSNDLPTRRFDDADLVNRVQWKKAQRLADHFWQRFVQEYLPTLVPRSPSSGSQNLKAGDLVLIADGTLPRRCWPRGRISATYPGKDNIVRVVDVTTKGGVLRRPVRKLALLIAS